MHMDYKTKGSFMNTNKETVDASPVKSFFVHMLTRDISLDDAILDLLDNCIDGAIRLTPPEKNEDQNKYNGYEAKITISKTSFSIVDNCGGIPFDVLKNYAFRMGRIADYTESHLGTVGTFGIGMKRAIFKMGQKCRLTTTDGKTEYVVEITPEWINNENDWNIPIDVQKSSSSDTCGTKIEISNLNQGVSSQFDREKSSFITDLIGKISSTYAFILSKGFKIYVNDAPIKAKQITFAYDNKIKPYIFKSTKEIGNEKVDIFLTVGLTSPLLSSEELDEKDKNAKFSSQDAGWTVICNDRVVLYCDKTELTGWGEVPVPKYHTQFISISGIVEFSSQNPELLPTTTTKRGIDTSNALYLSTKNIMREGTKYFTDLTNRYKGNEKNIRTSITAAKKYSFEKIKCEDAENLITFKKAQHKDGKIARPNIPFPKNSEDNKKNISFKVEESELNIVSNFLNIDGQKPSYVGERAFKHVLKEAEK